MKTSRQIVYDTLAGKNKERAPRQLWTLAWAWHHHPDEMKKLVADFPDDVVGVGAPLKKTSPRVKGDPNEIGEYTDDFGCTFTNVQRGVIGEVKCPLVQADDWSDADKAHIPAEWLSFDIGEANAALEKHAPDKFRLAGFCARPFEQLQFIRGTENLYVDLMDMPPGLRAFMNKLHTFYCDLCEKWAQTDADCLFFMDDWGTQRSLLINPALWRELFKPMYKDYIDIAKKHGKKAFMHSDGYTLDILPDLAELGLDAVNAQIFCMGLDNLKPLRGKLTFWGEIDRQWLLPRGTADDIRKAVRQVRDALYDDGYCIAQCEFGAGAKPENVYTVFQAWDEITGR
ncbi:MAG: methyltransferase [Clostridiales bacterium]|jgi:uroporphyrinogen-III decarboxylase|nr:methyltransferase [Clostridiales bacterium]